MTDDLTIPAFLDRRPDFLVSRDAHPATVYLLRPITEAAIQFADEAFSDATWFGKSIAVEHRFIGGLVEQLTAEGWRVE